MRTYYSIGEMKTVLTAEADEIERLRAENARLREALKQAMDDIPGWYDAARAALAEQKSTEEK